MKHPFFLLIFLTLMPLVGWAQEPKVLTLPRLEHLSARSVAQVIQDSEGYLWYATEGGGVCRDDGRQITAFRSDAEHPDLLGSNRIACVAEADGRYILIGTYHGAYILDKRDYNICRLTDVDDKRVDDIIVSGNGHWWLTANKKIYEYADGNLQHTYPTGNKYICRLHEDLLGGMWASEWDGGLLLLTDGQFKPMPWPVDVAPTIIDDNPDGAGLLVYTFGRGVVHYQPESGTVDFVQRNDSLYTCRVATDRQGRLLVADGRGKCYAVDSHMDYWSVRADSIQRITKSQLAALSLSVSPAAFARDAQGTLWFSTGKDIRMVTKGKETVVLPDTKDVSAITFSSDGTLWLATIFGTLMTYKDGQLATDEYASDEYGDAIIALQTDSTGRIVILSEHHARLYDPVKHTLRQQNIEKPGFYRIELGETRPYEHWSQPPRKDIAASEHIPLWMWWLLAVMLVVVSGLLGYVGFLHRQRKRFLEAMKKEPEPLQQSETTPALADEWLQQAISHVEKHMDDEHYSIEQLSSDLCMSRMTFYRKIQAATGQTPTEFMRTIRLRRAAELLREGGRTITEISYATGFSSISYFSRCFRTMYGVSPTQFVEDTR